MQILPHIFVAGIRLWSCLQWWKTDSVQSTMYHYRWNRKIERNCYAANDGKQMKLFKFLKKKSRARHADKPIDLQHTTHTPSPVKCTSILRIVFHLSQDWWEAKSKQTQTNKGKIMKRNKVRMASASPSVKCFQFLSRASNESCRCRLRAKY